MVTNELEKGQEKQCHDNASCDTFQNFTRKKGVHVLYVSADTTLDGNPVFCPMCSSGLRARTNEKPHLKGRT